MIEQPITIELIDKLITPSPEDYVFEMIKAIAMKKALVTYAIYEDLKALKESPIKIISLLYTQFKHMIQVQGYANMANRDICAKTGLVFWQVDKAKEVLGYFSTPELVEILLKIQRCEVDIKTGNIETDLAFDKLLLDIVG
jgi:DNA polymerase-3 subunit delta